MRSILLIEDDFFDTMTAQKSFEHFSVPHQLLTVFNGEEALDLLLGRTGSTPPEPLPEVILLDLNMPRMNGLEFLEILRGTPALAEIPVFIITTSGLETDRAETERLGVSGYILKPLDFSSSLDMVDSMNLLEKLLK